jgi:DNA polymerase (family X)
LPNVKRGALAGSIRRGRPTIGDVDILIDSADAPTVMDTFVAMDEVARVLGHGPTKSSVELHNGLQVDVRVLTSQHWGTALQYFSGSQQHNIRIRALAQAQGLSLNESAFSPTDASGAIIETAPKIFCEDEETVYATLGLPWIAPELREDDGEIEAAQQGTLPRLIERADIQGDLHMHTTWSDGNASVREMAEAALARGHRYIVITDHSYTTAIAGRLTLERLRAQRDEVRAVDAAMGGRIRVLHGTEMDIKADGTLDWPDEVLAELDFVIASLHMSLKQDRAQITMRLLNAIRNLHVDLIGHPRAQIIGGREPVDADMDAVFAAAAANGTAMEINANPRRLDLEAPLARRAISLGIPLAINTDAHTPDNLDLLSYGITTARRGWATAEHVINAWPWERFSAWLRRHE